MEETDSEVYISKDWAQMLSATQCKHLLKMHRKAILQKVQKVSDGLLLM